MNNDDSSKSVFDLDVWFDGHRHVDTIFCSLLTDDAVVENTLKLKIEKNQTVDLSSQFVSTYPATLVVYSFREGVNLTDIFDRSPNVQM